MIFVAFVAITVMIAAMLALAIGAVWQSLSPVAVSGTAWVLIWLVEVAVLARNTDFSGVTAMAEFSLVVTSVELFFFDLVVIFPVALIVTARSVGK